MKPRLLDLFCGAGGAAEGLHRAGFDITGVDIRPQPRYPFEFILADALEYPLDGYDAIWASPPCQRWAGCKRQYLKRHPDLLTPTRERLHCQDKPFIIENVPLAPMSNTVMLCGEMFGLGVIRHRKFESNCLLLQPPHNKHRGSTSDGTYVTVAGGGGRGSTRYDLWCKAMGIHWMKRHELIQAVPPCFAEFLGRQLIKYIGG